MKMQPTINKHAIIQHDGIFRLVIGMKIAAVDHRLKCNGVIGWMQLKKLDTEILFILHKNK